MKPLRRVLTSANVLVTVLLLAALFVMTNYLSSRRYARWDLSEQRITTLSDQTVQTLKALKEPVHAIVFYQQGQRLYELVTDLLQEYARVTPRITIERIDPEQDVARAAQYVKEFEIDASNPENLNLVIFRAGAKHKYLSDTDLADYDYSAQEMTARPPLKSFKGEEAFTSAIVSLTQGEAPLVWLTTGHGEKSSQSVEQMGIANLKRYLEQQNFVVKDAALVALTEIPSEVKLIMIIGPRRRFTEPELLLLHAYLRRGGRLLALIDPLEDTGLDGFCEQWGVRLGMDIVVDPMHKLPFVSAANLFVTTYTDHPVVKKMKTLMTLFPLARSVSVAQPRSTGPKVTPLALTSEEGWGETDTNTERFEFNEGRDVKGPVSIAVAVERPASPTLQQTGKARLVIIGDSDFIVNAQLGNVGNRDLLMGATHWLLEQEQLIGISPKPLETIKLRLTSSQLTGVACFSFLAMPSAFGILGLLMLWVRRQ